SLPRAGSPRYTGRSCPSPCTRSPEAERRGAPWPEALRTRPCPASRGPGSRSPPLRVRADRVLRDPPPPPTAPSRRFASCHGHTAGPSPPRHRRPAAWSRARSGEIDEEPAARARLGLHSQGADRVEHQASDDREPQPRAAGFGRVEVVEGAWQLYLGRFLAGARE